MGFLKVWDNTAFHLAIAILVFISVTIEIILVFQYCQTESQGINSCRQWLSNQGIVLNPGTKPYQIPTEQELQEREYKLKRWKSEIEQLEREAKEYCKKVYFCNV